MNYVTKLAAAISVSLALSAAHAQTVCAPLTPAALNDLTAAIEQAAVLADVAATAAGYDKDDPSTYPNSIIRGAARKWQETYLDYFPANAYVPYITPINVALYLNGTPNIEVNEALLRARWFATALAYHNQVDAPDVASKYLVARRAVQTAMNKMDQLGLDGARCGILVFAPQLEPLLP